MSIPKKDDIFVTVDCVGEVEITDKDIDLKESNGYDYEKDQDIWFIDVRKAKNPPEGEMVTIDEIMAILEKFKKKGATHVSAEHHVDHNGYNFAFHTVRKSTQEEASKFIRKLSEVDKLHSELKKAEKVVSNLREKMNKV